MLLGVHAQVFVMESASRVVSVTKVLSAKLQSEELQKMKVYETSFQMAFFMHLQITVINIQYYI